MASGREIRAGIDNLGLNGSLLIASANALAILGAYPEVYSEIPLLTNFLACALGFNFLAILLNLYQFRASRRTSYFSDNLIAARERYQKMIGERELPDLRAARRRVADCRLRRRKQEKHSLCVWWLGWWSIASGYLTIVIGLWCNR